MTPVILASPYAGDRARNLAYAHDCMLDSIKRGEAPLASHLLYPQVLNDDIPEDRALGLSCEWRWLDLCRSLVVYTDLSISPGMKAAMDHALAKGYRIQCRTIGNGWSDLPLSSFELQQ